MEKKSNKNEKETSESKTIEENISQLDKIVELLKSDDISLTEAMKCYREGVKLVSETNEMLDNVEKEIKTVEE